MATLSHEMRFKCQKLWVFASLDGPAATALHEMRFESQKLR